VPLKPAESRPVIARWTRADVQIGLVTPAYSDVWDDAQLVARRVAGALACGAEVDLLVPGGGPAE
jgi:hypothetical protein